MADKCAVLRTTSSKQVSWLQDSPHRSKKRRELSASDSPPLRIVSRIETKELKYKVTLNSGAGPQDLSVTCIGLLVVPVGCHTNVAVTPSPSGPVWLFRNS